MPSVFGDNFGRVIEFIKQQRKKKHPGVMKGNPFRYREHIIDKRLVNHHGSALIDAAGEEKIIQLLKIRQTACFETQAKF